MTSGVCVNLLMWNPCVSLVWCVVRAYAPTHTNTTPTPIHVRSKAATLKTIEEATQCKIDIPQREGLDGRSKIAIVVSGPVEGARTAEKAIKSLATKGYSALTSGDDFIEIPMNVHRDYFSDIVGKGGATIQAIREQLGVNIALPVRGLSLCAVAVPQCLCGVLVLWPLIFYVVRMCMTCTVLCATLVSCSSATTQAAVRCSSRAPRRACDSARGCVRASQNT